MNKAAIETETLAQIRCQNKECNKSMPFRYKIYDGKISARCRTCKSVTIRWYLKGQLLFSTVIIGDGYYSNATLLSANIKEGGGTILPIVI